MNKKTKEKTKETQTKRKTKSSYLVGPRTVGRSCKKEERGKGFVTRSEGI